MSEWKGMIIGCDRCGKELRRKRLGETELDGGFTHVERFEEMPETWKYRYEIGYLCPECNAEIRYSAPSSGGRSGFSITFKLRRE